MHKNGEEKNPLAGSVYDRLKERIMDQVFPPESRLNIDALAADLKVSPTPVREALARLAAERLITFEPFKGYRVSPLLSLRELADLIHVRRLIEIDAARLAAQRIQTIDLMTMEKLLQASEDSQQGSWSQGYRRFNLGDQKFHETLMIAAQNPFLLETYRSLHVHLLLGRFYQNFTEQDQNTTCDEHSAIYQALCDHDPHAAALAVEEHLHATEVRILKILDPSLETVRTDLS